jgi:hypothetical protein
MPELTLDDLTPWARRAFEEAYQQRPRLAASREDVAYGWIAALVWLHAHSSFAPDALRVKS